MSRRKPFIPNEQDQKGKIKTSTQEQKINKFWSNSTNVNNSNLKPHIPKTNRQKNEIKFLTDNIFATNPEVRYNSDIDVLLDALEDQAQYGTWNFEEEMKEHSKVIEQIMGMFRPRKNGIKIPRARKPKYYNQVQERTISTKYPVNESDEEYTDIDEEGSDPVFHYKSTRPVHQLRLPDMNFDKEKEYLAKVFTNFKI